jgi:hypothetical protein
VRGFWRYGRHVWRGEPVGAVAASEAADSATDGASDGAAPQPSPAQGTLPH